MGKAVKFEGCNFKFAAPEAAKNVVDLECFTNGSHNVLAVELTSEEHAEYMKTGRIFVSVLSGQHFFPIFVGTETSTRELVKQDGGVVWPSAEDLLEQKLIRETHKLLGGDAKQRQLCRTNPEHFNKACADIKRLLFNSVSVKEIRPIVSQYLAHID